MPNFRRVSELIRCLGNGYGPPTECIWLAKWWDSAPPLAPALAHLLPATPCMAGFYQLMGALGRRCLTYCKAVLPTSLPPLLQPLPLSPPSSCTSQFYSFQQFNTHLTVAVAKVSPKGTSGRERDGWRRSGAGGAATCSLAGGWAGEQLLLVPLIPEAPP